MIICRYVKEVDGGSVIGHFLKVFDELTVLRNLGDMRVCDKGLILIGVESSPTERYSLLELIDDSNMRDIVNDGSAMGFVDRVLNILFSFHFNDLSSFFHLSPLSIQQILSFVVDGFFV